MDPKGKAPAPIPPYRPDAQKGYLPSVPFPHAGPEPSGQTLQNILKGISLEDHAQCRSESMEQDGPAPESTVQVFALRCLGTAVCQLKPVWTPVAILTRSRGGPATGRCGDTHR